MPHVDLLEERQREMQEQAAEAERGRKRNIERFTQMWLSLGRDVLIAAGSSHQAEIAEALGLASWKWSHLLDMEGQILREQQALAERPAKRPTELADRMLAPEVVKRLGDEYAGQTKVLRDGLAELRELAAAERRELEALIRR